MSRTRLLIFGAIILAAGCAGNGSNNTVVDTVTGDVTLPTGILTPPTSVTAPAGTPTPLVITTGGTTESGFVMGGDDVAAGEEVLAIPDELPVTIEEDPDSTPGYNAGEEEVDENSNIPNPDLLTSAASLTRAQRGTILWHPADTTQFRDTGLRFASGRIRLKQTNQRVGKLFTRLADRNEGRTVTVRFVGPLTLSRLGTSGKLRVSKWIDLVFQTRRSGTFSSYPTRVVYDLPSNGGTMYNKRFDVTTSRALSGGQSTLRIRKSNGTKLQTVLSNSSKVSVFRNPVQDAQDQIPQSGVESIRLTLLLP